MAEISSVQRSGRVGEVNRANVCELWCSAAVTAAAVQRAAAQGGVGWGGAHVYERAPPSVANPFTYNAHRARGRCEWDGGKTQSGFNRESIPTWRPLNRGLTVKTRSPGGGGGRLTQLIRSSSESSQSGVSAGELVYDRVKKVG